MNRELIKISAYAVTIFGIIIAVIGVICSKSWYIIILILSLLKLTNYLNIDWFGSIYELSAIGTGLWLVLVTILSLMISTYCVQVANDLAEMLE